MISLRTRVNGYLARKGYQIIKLDPLRDPAANRAHLIRSSGVDLVIDVGASIGLFGEELRRFGYKGRIASFEPLRESYLTLSKKCAGDSRWLAMNLALGDHAGEEIINVSANSFSSSLLQISPECVAAIPKTSTVGNEKIQVSTLDDVFGRIVDDARCVYLKLDVQGYEKKLLSGGCRALPHIELVQLEMSLTPLYIGEPCFPEMNALMEQLGFSLVSLEPTLIHPTTGHMLQIDGVYRRRPAPA